jgi:hypothetical protein
VSNDLFAEWQKEIDEMRNPQLKSRSSFLLKDAKDRQSVYMKAMHKTEDQMTPVLAAFHDQVLFLKHNLNARAIGSLKGTSAKINADVTALTKAQADLPVIGARAGLVRARTALVNTARGMAQSYGERLRGCNLRNMNPEKADRLSPELQSALEPLRACIESVREPIRESASLPQESRGGL